MPDEFDPDPERVDVLRDTADDIRETGESQEAERIAAILYRISDVYDEDEDTDPEHVYRNMRNILRVTERGTLERD